MMIAVGSGLLIEMNYVTRIQFDESAITSVDGRHVSGATVYFTGPSVVKLSSNQANMLLGILNQIGSATPQPTVVPFPQMPAQ